MTSFHDIYSALPNHKDRYFVDTNVWFWFTYCASKEFDSESNAARYQVEKYPNFIEKVLGEGAKLFHCPLVFSELANIIERTEWEIYKLEVSEDVSRKQFRAIPERRKKVLNELKSAWKTINECSQCVDVILNKSLVSGVQALLESSALDSYDAFYLKIMLAENISKIITDDGDFRASGVEDIYTANNRLLRA